MKIDEARKEIDAIDEAIVQLLDRRASVVRGIGAAKARSGMPVFDRRRETDVMRSVARNGNGAFGKEALEKIYSVILLESRRLQRQLARFPRHSVAESR